MSERSQGKVSRGQAVRRNGSPSCGHGSRPLDVICTHTSTSEVGKRCTLPLHYLHEELLRAL